MFAISRNLRSGYSYIQSNRLSGATWTVNTQKCVFNRDSRVVPGSLSEKSQLALYLAQAISFVLFFLLSIYRLDK